MYRAFADQSIGAQLLNAADGSAFTGTVTIYITGDAGTQAIGSVGGGICTHEGNGYHTYRPSVLETDFALIAFTFIGTGAIPTTIQVPTESAPVIPPSPPPPPPPPGIANFGFEAFDFLAAGGVGADITANLVWSLPVDRNAGDADADLATKQRVRQRVIGIETDFRFVFAAAGEAAGGDDLQNRTLAAKFRKNSASSVFLTVTEGNGITTTGQTTFEVHGEAKAVDGFEPGDVSVDVYDVSTATETWLANFLVPVSDTAFKT